LSLTLDNGKEFARHEQMATKTASLSTSGYCCTGYWLAGKKDDDPLNSGRLD
jgi:hypothetical protein